MGTDDFGLDERILGHLPENIYAAIGRVACLSAVLENQIMDLRRSLDQAPPKGYLDQPATRHMKEVRELSARLPPEARDELCRFLDEATDLINRRNNVLHSIWLRSEGGAVFGHRKRVSESNLSDGVTKVLGMTEDDFQELIGDFSAHTLRFSRAFAATQGPISAVLPSAPE